MVIVIVAFVLVLLALKPANHSEWKPRRGIAKLITMITRARGKSLDIVVAALRKKGAVPHTNQIERIMQVKADVATSQSVDAMSVASVNDGPVPGAVTNALMKILPVAFEANPPVAHLN